MNTASIETEDIDNSEPSGFVDTHQQRAKKVSSLYKLADIIREHKRIYRAAMRGEIEVDDLVKFSMVLHRITQAMESSELDFELYQVKQALIEKGIMKNDGK